MSAAPSADPPSDAQCIDALKRKLLETVVKNVSLLTRSRKNKISHASPLGASGLLITARQLRKHAVGVAS